LERGWTVTWISLTGLGANALGCLVLIQPCLAYFGPGGAGMGAALSLMGAETLVTILLFSCVGKRAFDARDLAVIARTLGASAIVCAFHLTLKRFGDVRLLADALLYVILVLSFGAVRIDDVRVLFAHVTATKGGGRAS
jgi:hypothetical protein